MAGSEGPWHGRRLGIVGLRVPGLVAYRHLAIRLVSTACKMALGADHEPGDTFEAEVISGFGEAFNNIAIHGYRDLPPGPVLIEVDWNADRLIITMTDCGRTFDPASIEPPALFRLEESLDELPEAGMGLYIMNGCMDEVAYEPGPPNVLRLGKRRNRDRPLELPCLAQGVRESTGGKKPI